MFCTTCMYHVLHLYMFCSGATKGALCATGSKLSKPSGSTTGPPGRDLLSYLTSILFSLLFKIGCCCKRVREPVKNVLAFFFR